MKAVLTVTANPAVDVYVTVDRLVPREKLRCREPRRDPGGGGINVARGIRNLGGQAVAVYLSGGVMGEALGRMLADEGVEHYPVGISGEVRESLVVLEAESGREYRLVLPGPELEEGEWRRCLELLAAWAPIPDYLVGSGSLPPGAPEDFWARVAQVAERSGARMVLDTSGPALAEALEQGVYLAKPNRSELEALVGSRLEGEEALREASRDVVERGGCRVLALSLGAEGALLTWEGGHRRVRPPEVEIRSDVGAGDSFVAGMVLALARGRPVEEAFCFGVAAGTAALATPGTELCRREETEALFRQLCG